MIVQENYCQSYVYFRIPVYVDLLSGSVWRYLTHIIDYNVNPIVLPTK